jgi:hypothetical protein
MNENLKRAFDAIQKLPDAHQDIIAKHIWKDIEMQKQQKSFEIADKDRVRDPMHKCRGLQSSARRVIAGFTCPD